MPREQPGHVTPRVTPVWVCIVAALGLVTLAGTGIAVYDVRRDVATRRGEEIYRLQSHAERSAGHIASQLVEEGRPDALPTVRQARWLRSYWQQSLQRQPFRLYAAVLDLDGTVIAHTQREQEGRQVACFARGQCPLPVKTEQRELVDEVLTGGQRAIDMRVPIRQQDQIIGVYHVGLDADWLDEQMAQQRAERSRFWALLILGMCGVLLLSSVAVVRVTRHTAHLEHQIEAAHARRVSEMHELVLGMAHEIRNPLNAIRLNLHSVGQVLRGQAELSDEELSAMLEEMEREVVRLEALMREMLGFVRSEGRPAPPVDVAEEVHRTVTFLRAPLDQRRIELHLTLSDEPVWVRMEPPRLRQVLFNLLNNALEALPEGGVIDVGVRPVRGMVEITVADDGPGIPVQDRERVFVPFYSTKASGTGLGLALARKFVEEAGGTIRCEDSPMRRGCCFRILLPAWREAAVETVS
jgi:two-component system sensor histidine kinase HydH